MISEALIGGSATSGQNPLPNISQSLKNLDIATRASQDHQNHFHIYLKPPAALAIDAGPNRLLANSVGAEQVSLAVASTQTVSPLVLNTDEVFMFDYFVPPQLNNEPAALVAQANSSEPKMLKPFTFCQDVENGVTGSFSANAFTVFMRNEWAKYEELIKHKVRLVQAPEHGKITFSDTSKAFPINQLVTGIDQAAFQFIPVVGYTGKDRAVFEVEANNRKYRVIANFWVMDSVFDDGQGTFDRDCKTQKFGLLSDMPQSIASWQQSANLSALLAAASAVTYSFSNLPATPLGVWAAEQFKESATRQI